MLQTIVTPSGMGSSLPFASQLPNREDAKMEDLGFVVHERYDDGRVKMWFWPYHDKPAPSDPPVPNYGKIIPSPVPMKSAYEYMRKTTPIPVYQPHMAQPGPSSGPAPVLPVTNMAPTQPAGRAATRPPQFIPGRGRGRAGIPISKNARPVATAALGMGAAAAAATPAAVPSVPQMLDLDYTSHSKEEVVMENRFLVERLLNIHNITQDTLNQLGALDQKGE